MARRALVTGIGGQDGSYLAELLSGTATRSTAPCSAPRALRDAGRHPRPDHVLQLDLTDGEAVASAIRELKPDETYHLASVSFVPASWEDPVGTSTFAAAAPAPS